MATTGKLGQWQPRLIVGVIIAVLAGLLAWWQLVNIPTASSTATLDDSTLEVKALEWARAHGLQGTPLAKRAVRMTLGQWLAFSGGQLGPGSTQFGVEQNTSVFVLAIHGSVAWHRLGAGLQGRHPEQFNNITIVVDARNGNLVSAAAARNPTTMPIQVPLNTLTPAAPINFVPTQQPKTPPTRAPTRTPLPSILATPTLPALQLYP